MTWISEPAGAAAVLAFIGAAGGLGVPALIGRIPEPETETEEVDEADASPQPEAKLAEVPKEPYAAIARLPGLTWKSALAGGITGALIGGTLGWQWSLLLLGYLIPVGVALAVVDWRTRLLPTWVIAPSYGVLAALALLAGAFSGDWDDVVRAGWGWVIAGGTFLVLWLIYPRGMGYGDVRLSGILGIALGYLGWAPLLVGVYAGFLLGGLGGGLLTVLRIVDRKAYPFGPFMLLGAVVGVATGDWLAGVYAGG